MSVFLPGLVVLLLSQSAVHFVNEDAFASQPAQVRLAVAEDSGDGSSGSPGSVASGYDVSFCDAVVRIELQPDDRLLAACQDGRLRRYLPDGTVDTSFESYPAASGFWVAPDGGMVVRDASEAGAEVLVFLNADGVPTGFTVDVDGLVDDVLFLGDGRLLASGRFTTVNGVPRAQLVLLSPDGSVDPSFQPDAVLAGNGSRPKQLALLDGDRFLVSNMTASAGGLAVDGLVRFDIGGHFDLTKDYGYLGWPSLIRVPEGGGFVVSGWALYRLLPNGAFDPTFQDSRAGYRNGVFPMLGGRYLYGDGVFPSWQLERSFGDGTRDESFSALLDGDVLDAVQTSPDTVVIAGNFKSVNGVPRPGLAQLHYANSNAPGAVTFHAGGTGVPEKGSSGLYLLREGDAQGAAKVRVSAASGTANADADFRFDELEVDFQPGERRKRIEVTVFEDEEIEGDETFSLSLDSIEGAARGKFTNCLVTIADDDFTFRLRSRHGETWESEDPCVVTVERIGGASTPASVMFELEAPSSRGVFAGWSIFVPAGTIQTNILYFPPGAASRDVYLSVADNAEPDPPSIITLRVRPVSPSQPVGEPSVFECLAKDRDQPGFPADSFNGSILAVEPVTQSDSWVIIDGPRLHGSEVSALVKLDQFGRVKEDLALPNPWTSVRAIAPFGEGEWLLSVLGWPQHGLLRLDSEGRMTPRPSGNVRFAGHLAPAPDGSVISACSGQLGGRTTIWRHHPLDPNADKVLLSGIDARYSALAVGSDGDIWFGGKTSHPDFVSASFIAGSGRNVLWKLKPDGSKHPEFPAYSFSMPDLSSGVGLWLLFNLRAQPDGRIIVNGSFDKLNDSAVPPLLRFLPNGQLDASFQPDFSRLNGQRWAGRPVLLENGEIAVVAGDLDEWWLFKFGPEGQFLATYDGGKDPVSDSMPRSQLHLLNGTILLAGNVHTGFTRFFPDGTMSTSGPAAIHSLDPWNGDLRLRVQVRTGTPFMLESSADLESWEAATQVAPIPELQVIDLPGSDLSSGQRFFRLRQ